jgi:hypothetical protein
MTEGYAPPDAPSSHAASFSTTNVPVHVEVKDGLVSRATVINETPFTDPTAVEGDPGRQAAGKCILHDLPDDFVR